LILPSGGVAVIRPGPRNSLADVAGLLVGNAEDLAVRTGVTVVLPEEAALAAVDVRGGAPGTINTTALAPGGLVREVHGLVLAGGSAFGLEAATGLMTWLAARGSGFADWGPCVPIVAGAILFDLLNGGDKAWGEVPPYRRLAQAAAAAAGTEFRLGNAGAGLGAVAGRLKGGLGTASAFDPATGVTVAALVAANPLGSATMPDSPTFWAWHLEQAGELGGQPPPAAVTGHSFETKLDAKRNVGPATTIGVLATDARVPHEDLLRLAVMGQDGYAYAIRPIHSPLDGDTVFAVATGAVALPARPDALARLGAVAAEVVARAVMRGIFEAEDLGEHRCYRTVWGGALAARDR
jgi:L-aminopeptidase/D-esterase-like protein